MPNYSYACRECEAVSYESFRYEDRPGSIQCPCGGTASYFVDSPMIMKASYPDGVKRKGFAEMKEANKLVQEAAVSTKDTAKEIRKEIRKMGVRIEK